MRKRWRRHVAALIEIQEQVRDRRERVPPNLEDSPYARRPTPFSRSTCRSSRPTIHRSATAVTDGPACFRSRGNVTMHSGIPHVDAPQYAGRETVGVGHAPRRASRHDRASVETGSGRERIGWRRCHRPHHARRMATIAKWPRRDCRGAYGSMVSGMTRRRVAETFRGPRSSDRLQVRPGFRPATTPDGLDPVVPTAPGVRAGSIGSTKAAFSQGQCCPGSRPKPGKAVNSVARPGILLVLPHRRGTLTGRRVTGSAQGDPGTRSECRDPVPGEHQKPEQDRQGTGQMQRMGGVITMCGKIFCVISTTYRGGHYEST